MNARVKNAKNIVVLTGAGISADSGVPTFRDAGGIWAEYDYREVATPEGYAANPALVHEFYNLRRAGLANHGIGPLFGAAATAASRGRGLHVPGRRRGDLRSRVEAQPRRFAARLARRRRPDRSRSSPCNGTA